MFLSSARSVALALLISVLPSLFQVVSAAGGPDDRSVLLHPNGNTNKCLDVHGGDLKPGATVDIHDCDAVDHDGLNRQRWNLFAGEGKVKVHGTLLCLDAGRNPASGVPLTIQTCRDGSRSQKWYFAPNEGDQIILSGQGLCVDLTNGVEINGNAVRIWKCAKGVKNQKWIIGGI